MLYSEQLAASRRRNTDLYASAGIFAVEEACLRRTADVQCTLSGREEAKMGKEKMYV